MNGSNVMNMKNNMNICPRPLFWHIYWPTYDVHYSEEITGDMDQRKEKELKTYFSVQIPANIPVFFSTGARWVISHDITFHIKTGP